MEEAKTVRIDLKTLERLMIDVLTGIGVPADDAGICADVLLAADRRGIDSHGINRLKPIYYDRIQQGILNPVTQIEMLREGPTTAVLDGHNGMGMVVAKRAMATVVEKARKFGLGMVAVRNSALRNCGLLCPDGCGSGIDRNHRDQCPAVDRADVQR